MIAALRDGQENAVEPVRPIRRENFGENPEKWQKWWEHNKGKAYNGMTCPH
ncbi:unnamed protein product [marine sediment metagenome]|uniref:Uncharacterized protein n=1 Tax=marine sediment metagenome TaxID=412755 RepID=X1TRV5_9ZZZZ